MEGFCRACLIKYDESTDLIQYTEKNRRLFVYCTGLQVKRNDTFIFQLCKDCYANMKLACKFKKLCRTSDKRFKNYSALKNAGDTVDFNMFLKNSDDSLTFRLPLLSGNSTPANQKSKDDDNESICTSIRNFMTDILQGEEMPDSEARIIREVIEEEADVLDDSLDSHWLQDDVSVDTDFRLDFSFSPFSTPRSVNNDRCFTPKKYNEQSENQNYDDSNNLDKTNHIENIFKNINGNIQNDINLNRHHVLDKESKIPRSDDGLHDKDDHNNEMSINVQNFYVPNDDIVHKEVNAYAPNNYLVSSADMPNKTCTIDRNIEQALRNENNNEFSLGDLLLTPPVFQDASGASTPTINNILFGKKLDSPANIVAKYGVQGIASLENVESYIIEEILNTEPSKGKMDDNFKIKNKIDDSDDKLKNTTELKKEMKSEDAMMNIISEIQLNEQNNQFDLENFLCKLCEKKFESSKALSIHFTKVHRIKIIKKKIKTDTSKICNICGKTIASKSNYFRHLKNHQKSPPKKKPKFKCDICSLVCTSLSKLGMHMVVHDVNYVKKDTAKNLTCSTCGATFNMINNLKLHMRRHKKEYTLKCNVCRRGFYRPSDLTEHMRVHTGERPYECTLCPKKFARRIILAQHLRWHTTETLVECDYCDSKFLDARKLKLHLVKSKKCLKIRERLLLATNDIALKNVEDVNLENNQDDVNLEDNQDGVNLEDNQDAVNLENSQDAVQDSNNDIIVNESVVQNELPFLDTDFSN